MDKPFRTVACVGDAADLTTWLTDLLDAERATALFADIKAGGSALAFLGTERGPMELIVCTAPSALKAMVQADATVAVSPQPLSFAMVAATLGAPLCLPADDEPLPVDAIWDEPASLDADATLQLRIEAFDRGDTTAPIRGTVVAGRVSVGDTVYVPGIGAGPVRYVSAEEVPREHAVAGEVVALQVDGVPLDKEAVGACLVGSERRAVTSVRIEATDGGGRLWWATGWVRIRVENGVGTLRSPRHIPAGTRGVIARDGVYQVCHMDG